MTLSNSSLSVLGVITQAAYEVGVPPPQVANEIDDTVSNRQFVALFKRAGEIARRKYVWPQLTREQEITLVDGQPSYALADDFDYQIFDTHWSVSDSWRLIGPLNPQEWRERKNGITGTSPRQRFRVKGRTNNRLFIDPTPGPGDAGNTIIFEYQSNIWFVPKLWGATTGFGSGAYCFYNGNIYLTYTGGVTGSTPPTHTSGSASDGGITWEYYSGPFNVVLTGSELPLIPGMTLALGVAYLFMRQKGQPFQELQDEFEKQLAADASSERGARAMSLLPRCFEDDILLSARNIPDTGYGV